MKAQRGVTLVELLVSMLILSAVMGLVAQAVSQVERIVRIADESQQLLAERWGGGWALQLLFANLVAPREGGSEPFQGGVERLEGFGSAALLDGGGGLRRFELRLRPASAQAAQTELLYLELDRNGRSQGEPQVVARFPGAAGFSYRDRRGAWGVQWPRPGLDASGPAAERLPSAVRVTSLGGQALYISYPVLASASLQRGDATSPFGRVEP